MGASEFSDLAVAKDATKAFNALVDEALYDHGHSGYTGTIAEKPGYTLVGQLSGQWLKDHKIIRVIQNQMDYLVFDPVTKKLVDVKKKPPPPSIKELVQKAVPIYDDKWGPAVCFEITGPFAVEEKRRAGRSRTRDKVFFFCGLASE